MLDDLVFVQTLSALRDGAFALGDRRSMIGAAFAAELGGVIADIAEALHDDALALEAGRQARAASCSAGWRRPRASA